MRCSHDALSDAGRHARFFMQIRRDSPKNLVEGIFCFSVSHGGWASRGNPSGFGIFGVSHETKPNQASTKRTNIVRIHDLNGSAQVLKGHRLRNSAL